MRIFHPAASSGIPTDIHILCYTCNVECMGCEGYIGGFD